MINAAVDTVAQTAVHLTTMRIREVLLGGSPILRRGGAHAWGTRGPDSGPTPDPLSLCQDDINLTVTCFNDVFTNCFKNGFFYILSFVTANICPMV